MSSVVCFDNPVRQQKRRKKMHGTDSDSRPEIKKRTLFTSMAGSYDLYNLFKFNNVACNFVSDTQMGSWVPIKLKIPEQGTDSYRRVGSSYFLKYIRLKGCIVQKSNCTMITHWRLRLIRLENEDLDEMNPFINLEKNDSASAFSAANQYMSFYYRNPRPVGSVQSAQTLGTNLSIMYHTGIKNYENSDKYTSKVIASGVINDTARARSGGYKPRNSNYVSDFFSVNAGAVVPLDWDTGTDYRPVQDTGYQPIDIKVVLNDNIRFEWTTPYQPAGGDSDGGYYSTRVSYWMVLETDNPCGTAITGPYNPPPETEVYPSYVGDVTQVVNSTVSNFWIIFNQIQYYTDS